MTTSFSHRLPAILTLALVWLAATPSRAEQWTVFELPPCALVDMTVTSSQALMVSARGPNRSFAAQGGDKAGCGVPANAQGLLVDVLIDAQGDRHVRTSKRESKTPPLSLRAKRGLTAQSAVVELCEGRACAADVAIDGLERADRVRLFVRGYLMRGQRHASTRLTETLRTRDRQRVRDCEVLHGPNGEIFRIGTDCGLDYSGVPRGRGDSDSHDNTNDTPELEGCPYDYFDEDDWRDEQTTFRFPVSPAEWIVPTAIHMDHDRTAGANHLDCDPWFPGIFCYDNHEGTDFSLIGGFWKQDDNSVYAVAAADGVVMDTRESRFDRCEADIQPFDCSASVCTTFLGQTVCTPCVPNPDFGKPFCQEGDEERDYDGLLANYVRLCHADGTISRYLHLMRDEVLVDAGDKVECGDRLGLIGSSGKSAAPHLHFDVRRQGIDEWVDPYDAGSGESLWVQPSLPGFLPGTACE